MSLSPLKKPMPSASVFYCSLFLLNIPFSIWRSNAQHALLTWRTYQSFQNRDKRDVRDNLDAKNENGTNAQTTH